jgi:hypothetical protein
MEVKQTAVEWLVEQMSEKHYGAKTYFGANKKLIEQSKEMEKEQLYNFVDFINERHFNSFRISKDEVEQYYSETFKSEISNCKHENEQMRQGNGFVYVVCKDCGIDL